MKIPVQTILDMNPCERSKNTFLASIGKKKSVNIEHILKSNDINDTLWALYRLPNDFYPEIFEKRLLMTNEFAYLALHNFENQHPDDKRPRQALEAVEKFIKKEITIDELRSAAESARSAAESAMSAGSAARSAAWSAMSAAESAMSAGSAARSAAESAMSAWSAWSAAMSAESAAMSAARSADYARSTESAAMSAGSAAWSAAESAAKEKQKQIILKYFGSKVGNLTKVIKKSSSDITKDSIAKTKKKKVNVLLSEDVVSKAKKEKKSISKFVNENFLSNKK